MEHSFHLMHRLSRRIYCIVCGLSKQSVELDELECRFSMEMESFMEERIEDLQVGKHDCWILIDGSPTTVHKIESIL